jgi:hypothetical protein
MSKMPRFIVPRSTRTMNGTVTPASVVVIAICAAGGGEAGSYGLKHAVAGGVTLVGGAGFRKLLVFGLGSGNAFVQARVVR